MRRFMMFAAITAMVGTSALAAPCKDPKGKFVKCPPPAAKPATASAAPAKIAAPARAPAALASGVVKDKNGRCHVASGPKKGQFAKCA